MLLKLLRFVKVEHTVFSLPLLFAGAWLGAGRGMPTLATLGYIALAGVGARTLGMAINRIVDRKIDALNPRTAGRELPRGSLSLAQALAVAATGLMLYLTACALLGPVCLALAPVPLVPLLGYSYLKRVTAMCHFGIGLVLALAPLGAYVAAAGHTQIDGATWLLALFAFTWMSGFDIIYAMQDREADLAIGVHSVPAAVGVAGARLVSGALHLVALAALALILALAGAGVLSCLMGGGVALAFILAHSPQIPLAVRFFPLSAVAGVGGALVPLLGGGL